MKRYINLSILNSLCYTAGWFWCVLFGIHGHWILAVMGALSLILLQIYLVRVKDTFLYIQDILLAFFSTLLGIILEIVFMQIGAFYYSGRAELFPPIWIVCLYPLFSLLLNHSLALIKKSYLASFFLGFLGAPLSYMAGVSLGGITLQYGLLLSWIFIGLPWGLLLCFLIKIANMIEKAAQETLKERDLETHLNLLYDGECPLCKREVCVLQKKGRLAKIKFVDIASKEFLLFEHKGIDYKSAMSQIHAIDDNGRILVGVDAFAAVYARCRLLVISTLLRLPFISCIIKPLYILFAKNRLWITGRKKR